MFAKGQLLPWCFWLYFLPTISCERKITCLADPWLCCTISCWDCELSRLGGALTMPILAWFKSSNFILPSSLCGGSGSAGFTLLLSLQARAGWAKITSTYGFI